jgi:hypothetical protein
VVNAGTDGSGSSFLLVNNTVYQPVGDAIRVLANSPRVIVRNNVLQVTAGYDLNIDPSSQATFNSDYNDLSRGNDPRAHVGFWGSLLRDQLSDWQAATTQDAHSVNGDPQWVDINGADNVLGYTTSNGGYDGGKDDNFYVISYSPAIDSGDSWYATLTDTEGFNRVNDPATPNTGSPDYTEGTLVNGFTSSGVAQNWRAYNYYYAYTLPFAFTFYGTTYTTAQVSTSGFLQLAGGSYAGDYNNSTAGLVGNTRIAPLWANIRTDRAGNDIFVDTSVANQVTIRWAATNVADGSPVNFSTTLFSDGRIRFNYGSGNTNLTPTIGVSSGNGLYHNGFQISGNSGQATLTNAATREFTLQPGTVDMGAYEFRTTSADVTPPTVASTSPLGIQTSGTIPPVGTLSINFSEAINSVDANAPAAYELRGAGPDGLLDTSDDIRYTVVPNYVGGATGVSLSITGATTLTGTALPWSGALPVGQYRITVFSLASGGIHDLSGLALDGDSNGTAGGNYVRGFTVGTSPLVLTGTVPSNSFYLRKDIDGINLDIWQNSATPGVGAPSQQVVLAGISSITVTGNTGNDSLTLDFVNGSPIPATILFSYDGLGGVNTLAIVGTAGNDVLNATTTGVTFSSSTGGFAPLTLPLTNVQTVQMPGGTGGNDAINVLSGNYNVMADTAAGTPNVSVAVSAAGIATFSGNQHLAGLTVTDGRVNVVNATRKQLSVNTLSLTGNAILDVNINDLMLGGGTPTSLVVQYLKQGYAGGNWNGTKGIISTAANTTSNRTLGYAVNGDPVVPTIAAGQALVRYTIPGDANLSGTTDFTDFQILSTGFNAPGGWARGDFNYSGVVDFTDFQVLTTSYLMSLPPEASDGSSSGTGSPTATPAASGAPTTAAASIAPATSVPPSTETGPTAAAALVVDVQPSVVSHASVAPVATIASSAPATAVLSLPVVDLQGTSTSASASVGTSTTGSDAQASVTYTTPVPLQVELSSSGSVAEGTTSKAAKTEVATASKATAKNGLSGPFSHAKASYAAPQQHDEVLVRKLTISRPVHHHGQAQGVPVQVFSSRLLTRVPTSSATNDQTSSGILDSDKSTKVFQQHKRKQTGDV